MSEDAPALAPTIAFPELCRLCEGRYPPEITNNLDVLFRTVLAPVTADSDHRRLAVLRRALVPRFLPEYLLVKNAWGFSTPRTATRPDEQIPVLMLLYPYRADHHAFLFPIARLLSDRGIRTAVLVSRRSFRPEPDTTLFNRASILFEEDFYSLSTCWSTREHYRRLASSLERLSSELRLGSRQHRALKTVYLNYCLQRQVLSHVLELTGPTVVYGLTFVLNPGFLDAINAARTKATRPLKILIQHGVFGAGGFHDFKGADEVLVWGDYSQSMLSSEFLIPVPATRVVGNPKVEIEIAKRPAWSEADTSGNASLGSILYVSTPDSPRMDYNQRALILFAQSLRSAGIQWRITYKPHPAERMDTYNALVTAGLMKEEEIAPKGASIYDLIDAADVVVGTTSTCLIEAMALGKPVVQLLPEESGTDWHRLGLHGTSDQEGLRQTMQSLLSDASFRQRVVSEQQPIVQRINGPTAGSGQAIADYLANLLTLPNSRVRR